MKASVGNSSMIVYKIAEHCGMLYSNCNQIYLLLIILIKEVVNRVVYIQEGFHDFIFRSTDSQIYKSYELNEFNDLHVIESRPSKSEK